MKKIQYNNLCNLWLTIFGCFVYMTWCTFDFMTFDMGIFLILFTGTYVSLTILDKILELKKLLK